ncbi:MAG: AsmA-like C-terminal region-containing protein [Acetobacteraceae bacterium]|nr:AsmA-like C-terminal region-containing protein [Acetobacteraceae bacterium]
MRRLPGQAARSFARLLHTLAHVAMAVAVVGGLLLAAAAWRLSRGPVDLVWLTHRIEATVNADGGPTTLSIGSTALAWEGFARGVDRPLDLRLTDVRVTDAGGRRQVDVPRAEVSLSIGALLRGRVEPRGVELDGARLTLRRAADGTTSVDLGTLGETTDTDQPESEAVPATKGPSPVVALLAELARPATNDRGQARGMFSQLRRVRISDASVVIVDRQLEATWHAPHGDIDLKRRDEGGVDGTAALTLALGDQTATLAVVATLGTGAGETGTGQTSAGRTHLRIRLSPVAPAALARAAPKLAPLAGLDAPVSLEATLDLGATLQPERGRLTAHIGSGAARIGGSVVPIQDAALVVEGTPELISLQTARLALLGHDGGAPTVLQASGTVRHEAGRYAAALTLDLDQLDFADLGRLWPEDIGHNARVWLVGNITAGMARNGHVEASLEATDSLTDLALTSATGTLEGSGLTVHWLRPVPPIEDGAAVVRIVDPDTLDIAVSAGHQRSGKTGLTLKSGRMRITGMSQHDQYSTIQADITGPVPDTIALLKEPRLELLDKHPIELRDPAGDAAVTLTVTLPLDNKVTMDDIGIHAVSHLTGLHLGALVAGHDLDQGVLDLDATADGLTVKGHAQLAGIAAQLDAMMDFRTGPPTQVVQRVVASGRPGAGQLVAAGLDPNGTLFGEVPLKATYLQHRAGDAQVALEADFTPATLVVPPIGWRKPVGVPAKGTAVVLLDKDRLRGIERIAVDGDGLTLRGSARAAGGQIVAVQVDRAVFGRNDLQGSVQMPDRGPIAASLSGASIDLAPKLTAKSPKKEKSKGEPPAGPAWTLDAQFDRVLLAGDRMAAGVKVHVENDGRLTQVLHVNGRTGGTAPFAADIVPDRGVRTAAATAADAGALLRGLDVVRTMEAGTLSIKGRYDDGAVGHPLIGTALIDGFRVRGAPGLAKLLQAMTLYGLVDVLRGPGIGFEHLIAPFRYDDDGLTLDNARAFSPSLGLTAKGRIDLDDEQIDMEGTIVPAYFFNSLLGNIPLIGKLFSPEQGGGVFAAKYALRGPLDDPSVSVNPLSALTPGFLRNIFGLF